MTRKEQLKSIRTLQNYVAADEARIIKAQDKLDRVTRQPTIEATLRYIAFLEHSLKFWRELLASHQRTLQNDLAS